VLIRYDSFTPYHCSHVRTTMNGVPVMGPVGVYDSFTSTRPPRFGDPMNGNYPSYRRDVELWLKLTEVQKSKQGVAMIGCLSGEPK
jgi:hypothetical protein